MQLLFWTLTTLGNSAEKNVIFEILQANTENTNFLFNLQEVANFPTG